MYPTLVKRLTHLMGTRQYYKSPSLGLSNEARIALGLLKGLKIKKMKSLVSCATCGAVYLRDAGYLQVILKTYLLWDALQAEAYVGFRSKHSCPVIMPKNWLYQLITFS